jgi:uncharacterized membrane protein YkvA (DUF1232 family)
VTPIAWIGIGLATALAVWILLVLGLVVAGRGGDAREVASFIPDCIVLCKRLLSDPRVPRRAKFALALMLAYLALPFDLVPDFIPVAGQLDDAAVVAATLAYLVRRSGRGVVEELWPGSPRGLRVILALAPASDAATPTPVSDTGSRQARS